MPVAKSFQNLKIISDVYRVDGRDYVKVQNDRGFIRQVRMYTDAEYKKLYGEETPKAEVSKKDALGFADGYITIFKGNTYPYKDWFKDAGARYNALWGWYFSSSDEVPEVLPSGVEGKKLWWDNISNPRGTDLGPKDYIVEAIEELIYEPSNSVFVGEIGDTLTIEEVFVESKISFNGNYGPSNMYRMVDPYDNVFTWFTATSPMEQGKSYKIKGVLKKHETYKREKQNNLTRCKVLEVLG